MHQILVTGGAGFIGNHLVDYLLSLGDYRIRILDNLSHPNRARVDEMRSHPRIEFITGDVRDLTTVMKAVDCCDLIFHLAAQSNVIRAENDPVYAFESNVTGTFYVLHAAQKCGVQRVLFTSSREVYGDAPKLPVSEEAPLQPRNIYGFSKVSGELQCELFRERHGLDVRIVRLTNVYGPGDSDRVIPRFCQAIHRGEPLTIYGGEQVIDFVRVQDVIQALWQVWEVPALDKPINIATGYGITVRQLAERLCDLSNRSADLEILPGRAAEVSGFIGDTTRMRTILGWSPDGLTLAELSALLEAYSIENIPPALLRNRFDLRSQR